MVRNPPKFNLPKEVIKTIDDVNREAGEVVRIIGAQNKKLNEPIIQMYKRYLKARKPKDFEFTEREFQEINISVAGHFQIFRQILVGMDGGRNNLQFEGANKSRIVSFYEEIFFHIIDLEDIWQKQYDVLMSGASMRQKTSAFISLFDEERDVYKAILKSTKRFPTIEEVKKDFWASIKKFDFHGINGKIFALCSFSVTIILLWSGDADAAESVATIVDRINNVYGLGIGRVAYLGGVWVVFQWIADGAMAAAARFPGIYGLVQFLSFLQLIKSSRRGISVVPWR